MGISHPTKNPDFRYKKSPGYPECKKSRKNLESRRFCINSRDKNPEFSENSGIIPVLRKLKIFRSISNFRRKFQDEFSEFFDLAQSIKSRFRISGLKLPNKFGNFLHFWCFLASWNLSYWKEWLKCEYFCGFFLNFYKKFILISSKRCSRNGLINSSANY